MAIKVVEKKKKVLVAGTFQIIHPGHVRFLNEAARLGQVWVVISRNRNVRKGFPVVVDEKQRLDVVQALKPVYKAILGSENDFLAPVRRVRPDIILLGPDQMSKECLKAKLKAAMGLKCMEIEVRKLRKKIRKHKLHSTSRIIREIRKI